MAPLFVEVEAAVAIANVSRSLVISEVASASCACRAMVLGTLEEEQEVMATLMLR